MARRLIPTVTMAVLVCTVSGSLAASSRYLRHPVFQKLPPMEIRVESQFGYGDTGDLPFGLLGGLGIGLSDALTVGGYASVFTSDRDLPVRMKSVYGFGGFAEYGFVNLGYSVVPYLGIRAGFLDPTGPAAYPTVANVAGYLGLRIPVTRSVSVSVAATYHWAHEKNGFGVYNYRRAEDGIRMDNTDVTFDAGLRYAF